MSTMQKRSRYAIGSWQEKADREYENSKYNLTARKKADEKEYQEDQAVRREAAAEEEPKPVEPKSEKKEERGMASRIIAAIAAGAAGYAGAREPRKKPTVRMAPK